MSQNKLNSIDFALLLKSGKQSKHLIDAEEVKGGYFIVSSLDELADFTKYSVSSSGEITDGTIIEGSLCYCQKDTKFYQYNGEEWIEASGATITLVNSLEDIPNDTTKLYRYEVDGVSSNIAEVISEYHEGGDSNTFSKTSTSNNSELTTPANVYTHFDTTLSNFVTINSVTKVWTYKNNYPMNGLRFGTGKVNGVLDITLASNGTLTFSKYFGFNGSTNTVTSYDTNAVVIIDGTTYNFEADDETEIYVISTTLRRNPNENIISSESPLGGAIMGKKVGDRIEVKLAENNSYFVKIVSLEKGEDDASLPITTY